MLMPSFLIMAFEAQTWVLMITHSNTATLRIKDAVTAHIECFYCGAYDAFKIQITCILTEIQLKTGVGQRTGHRCLFSFL